MLRSLEIEEMVEQTGSFVSYKTINTKSGRRYLLRRYIIDESTGLDQVDNWRIQYSNFIEKLSKVKSPTLRSIIDGGIDEQDGNPYIIFEWLHSNTLDNVIVGQHGLSSQDLLDMVRAVLLGVSILHERGFTHSRVNLHSVLYNETKDKYTWVLDWSPLAVFRSKHGVNRFLDDIFSSPELSINNNATVKSDLYAIGKVVEASIGNEEDRQFLERWLVRMTSSRSGRQYKSVEVALSDLVSLAPPAQEVNFSPPVVDRATKPVEAVREVISGAVNVISHTTIRSKEYSEEDLKRKRLIKGMAGLVLILIVAAVTVNFLRAQLSSPEGPVVTEPIKNEPILGLSDASN